MYIYITLQKKLPLYIWGLVVPDKLQLQHNDK